MKQGLKIPVSAVRFRPEPPLLRKGFTAQTSVLFFRLRHHRSPVRRVSLRPRRPQEGHYLTVVDPRDKIRMAIEVEVYQAERLGVTWNYKATLGW